jgi:elongation of very long chain fatty acids protein 4
MDRLTASWAASQRLYDERITKGSFPSLGLDSLPTGLAFLNPHKLEAIVAANIAYLAIVFVIVRFVKSNGPVSDSVVKPFMLLYNAACVVLAGAVTVGILHYKLTVKLGSFACNIPDLGTPAGERLAWYIWLYYAQKYWEYLDTVIFALRGSFRQLSFLHVYHHVSITFVTSAFLRHDVNGDCYAAALANSFIHVLMYSHYFCSALGVNAWWRKHLTSGKSSLPPPLPTFPFPCFLRAQARFLRTMMVDTGQLVQFLTIFAQAWLMWFSGPSCGYPDWTKALMIAYQFSMLILFGQFFMASYGSKKSGHKDKEGKKRA